MTKLEIYWANIKGLQSRIKLENSHVLFIWCRVHQLNLVVTSIISKGKDVIDILGNLESLYAFYGQVKNEFIFFDKNTINYIQINSFNIWNLLQQQSGCPTR